MGSCCEHELLEWTKSNGIQDRNIIIWSNFINSLTGLSYNSTSPVLFLASLPKLTSWHSLSSLEEVEGVYTRELREAFGLAEVDPSQSRHWGHFQASWSGQCQWPEGSACTSGKPVSRGGEHIQVLSAERFWVAYPSRYSEGEWEHLPFVIRGLYMLQPCVGSALCPRC